MRPVPGTDAGRWFDNGSCARWVLRTPRTNHDGRPSRTKVRSRPTGRRRRRDFSFFIPFIELDTRPRINRFSSLLLLLCFRDVWHLGPKGKITKTKLLIVFIAERYCVVEIKESIVGMTFSKHTFTLQCFYSNLFKNMFYCQQILKL